MRAVPNSFLALLPPPEVSAAVGPLLSRTKELLPRARPVNPEGVHVTLAFLGRVGDDRLRQLDRPLAVVCAQSGGFSLRLGDLGAFPDLVAPRVLFLELLDEDGQLLSLGLRTRRQLVAEGFALDQRPLVPHLTLARLGTGVGDRGLMQALAGLPWPRDQFVARQIALMQTRQSGGGAPDYLVRRSWPLSGPTT